MTAASTPARFATIADLAPMAGREIAASDWLAVTQAKIDEFAAEFVQQQSPQIAQRLAEVRHQFIDWSIVRLLKKQLAAARGADEAGFQGGADRARARVLPRVQRLRDAPRRAGAGDRHS